MIQKNGGPIPVEDEDNNSKKKKEKGNIKLIDNATNNKAKFFSDY